MKRALLISGILAANFLTAQNNLSTDSIKTSEFAIDVASDGALQNWRFVDSNQSIMYNQNLWIGGMSGGALHQSSQTYRQGKVEFYPGPVSTDTSATTFYNRVWKVSRAQVDSLRFGLYNTIPDVLMNWPAHGDTSFGEPFYLAPYNDANQNGYYDPTNGDYPSIRGDEAIFFVFNDKNDSLNPNSLDLEIQGMLYRFDGGGILDSTFFVDYKLTNRSQNTYTDTWISSFGDMDMGNHLDDLGGTDIPSNAVFVYNGDPEDEGPSGFGHTLASAAMFLRKGPVADYRNGVDDDRDCGIDAVRDASGNCVTEDSAAGIREHMLMTASSIYNNRAGFTGTAGLTDPSDETEERNFMMGLCKSGGFLEVNGNDSLWGPTIPSSSCAGSTRITSFAFPGSSFDSTGSVSPSSPIDWYEGPVDKADKRALLSSGPFTFKPGQSISLRLGFMWHIADSATSSEDGGYNDLLNKLRGSSGTIDSVDTTGSSGSGGLVSISEPLQTKDFRLFYDQSQQQWIAETHESPLRLQLYSLQGKLLKEIRMGSGEQRVIDLSALPRGIYVLADAATGKTYKLLR